MTQEERRCYLIKELLREQSAYGKIQIPKERQAQKNMLRSLLNIRMPQPAGKGFLEIQDAYLQEEIRQRGITELADLSPVREGVYLWKGDITTLKCDAVVNAANSRLLGCFCPCHGCIDNAIHTFSGVQLRAACSEIMEKQGREEETGKAKITPAYNLPCKYIIHTVGPVVRGRLTKRDEDLLASCYGSCLELAEENQVKSIAFCCISTGEFHFPNERAAEIAVSFVEDYRKRTKSRMEVIWNVFKDMDYEIYKRLLTGSGEAEKGIGSR